MTMTQATVNKYADKLYDQAMVLTSLELVLVIAIDAVYGNNTGMHIEHILFSRKKINRDYAPKTTKTKS